MGTLELRTSHQYLTHSEQISHYSAEPTNETISAPSPYAERPVSGGSPVGLVTRGERGITGTLAALGLCSPRRDRSERTVRPASQMLWPFTNV